ncbi:unnamed protein product [Adineta steineri]|uniref:Uncharacterized protein n=1 Tax=Adineta steineri TaxID=433720 RepID=A0A819BMV2_9BILA|nr:unnamed protein product [Adineta steineri]
MNRLVFRPGYFRNTQPPQYRGTLSLTLEQFWRITFLGPPRSVMIDSHYLIVRDFTFHVTLITDSVSVMKSDDRLGTIGGSFLQNYTLPVDPMLLLQRTGSACMSEDGWPPNSITPETTEYFYDDTCGVEEPQAPHVVGCQQCHCTHPLPTMSCVKALEMFVGRVNVSLNFTRIRYNKTIADEWRFPNEPSINSFGEVAPVNIFEYLPDLQSNRVIYLYIEPDGCEIVEQCVGGSGWRRLLTFSTTTPNFGTQDLRLGTVSYFTDGLPNDAITKHHIFEYSPCHKHFHFSHYGSFTFGNLKDQSNLTNSKRGFCLQAVYRHANAEWSPLNQDYYTCSLQGIPAGWRDTYQSGLRCQWIDVTSIDTSIQSYTAPLYSSLNPDGFLCEGTPQPDTWVRTEFNTTCCSSQGCCGNSNETQCCGGEPVDRVGCETWEGAQEDNVSEVMVTLPLSGEGQVTEKCWNSTGSWGEKRDCGLKLHPKGKYLTCNKPSQQVALKNVISTDFYQVVRVCEASIALRSGLACIWNDSLANVIISHKDEPRDVHFICPPKRDSIETGGRFAVYFGPLFTELSLGDVSWSSIGQ